MLYEKYADIVVDEEDKDLEGSLQVVLEALKNRGIRRNRGLWKRECFGSWVVTGFRHKLFTNLKYVL